MGNSTKREVLEPHCSALKDHSWKLQHEKVRERTNEGRNAWQNVLSSDN